MGEKMTKFRDTKHFYSSINDLATLHGLTSNHDLYSFAEEIILECASVALGGETGGDSHDMILEHFGVE